MAELLRSVEFGEAVAITRHGKAIAHLIPAREHESDRRKRAVAPFREARRRWRRIAMSTEEILAARHEGRPGQRPRRFRGPTIRDDSAGAPTRQYPASTGNRSSSGSGCTPRALRIIDTFR